MSIARLDRMFHDLSGNGDRAHCPGRQNRLWINRFAPVIAFPRRDGEYAFHFLDFYSLAKWKELTSISLESRLISRFSFFADPRTFNKN